MSPRSRTILLASLLTLIGSGCRDRSRPNSRLLIQVAPKEATVVTGGRVALQATRLGRPDPHLTWTLEASSPGVILPGGVFLAPHQPGLSRIYIRDERSGEEAVAVIHTEADLGEPGGSDAAERYDLKTITRHATGRLRHPRIGPGTCLLRDGTVLVHGGTGEESLPPERFDPRTGTFKPCLAYGLPRTRPTLTRLTDGRVLVLGGGPNQVELYDPEQDQFLDAGTWPDAAPEPVTLLLPSGMMLVFGNRLQVLDPAHWTFKSLESPDLSGLLAPTLSLLPDGRILLAGGVRSLGDGTERPEDRLLLLSADLGKVEPAGTLKVPRGRHVAHVLPNGRVLFFGGRVPMPPPNGPTPPEVVEEWDPKTLQTSIERTLDQPVPVAPMVALPDGRGLTVGALPGQPPLADLYQVLPLGGYVRPLAPLGQPRSNHGLALLADGSLLVIGGEGSGSRTRRRPGARP